MTFPADDDFHLAKTLLLRPGRPKLLGTSDLLAKGVGELHDGNLLAAVIALRQQVRISAATGRLLDEHWARRRLAEAFQRSGEFAQAAVHVVTAGETKPVKALALSAGEQFIDVTDRIVCGPSWERAVALRLTAEQADLLPDALVQYTADQALDILEPPAQSTLAGPFFENASPHLAAHNLLAALAQRLSLGQATRLLHVLRPQANRAAGVHRRTDEDHAAALAAAAHAHPALRPEALDQFLLKFPPDLGQRVLTLRG
jgi:hypothetical protein